MHIGELGLFCFSLVCFPFLSFFCFFPLVVSITCTSCLNGDSISQKIRYWSTLLWGRWGFLLSLMVYVPNLDICVVILNVQHAKFEILAMITNHPLEIIFLNYYEPFLSSSFKIIWSILFSFILILDERKLLTWLSSVFLM